MCPHACQRTEQFVLAFCQSQLSRYGFQKLILIGSRASGKHRPNSDHDFVAVVDDAAPDAIRTGGTLHSQIFDLLNRQRTSPGLGEIDLLIMRSTHYETSDRDVTSLSHSWVANGCQVYP